MKLNRDYDCKQFQYLEASSDTFKSNKKIRMQRGYVLAFEDSDDKDEFVVRRPRWIRDREDHFHSLDDTDFVMKFRLSKRTVLSVLGLIEVRIFNG